jgi:hypothetical protein
MGILFEDEALFGKLIEEFPTLEQILSKFGVDVTNIKVLSDTGSHGVAFTDGKLVVKLTDDPNEARSSAKIVGKTITGVNPIHYVGKLAHDIPYHDPTITTEKVQYYVIIQDMVDTRINKQEGLIANLVGDFLVLNKKWPLDIDWIIREIYREAYRKTHQNLISPRNTEIMRSLLQNVQALYSHGVKYMDVSRGNVGKDSEGNLVVFDLGVSETSPVEIATVG